MSGLDLDINIQTTTAPSHGAVLSRLDTQKAPGTVPTRLHASIAAVCILIDPAVTSEMTCVVARFRGNSAVPSQRPGAGRKRAKRQLPQERDSCLRTCWVMGDQGDISRDAVDVTRTGWRADGR